MDVSIQLCICACRMMLLLVAVMAPTLALNFDGSPGSYAMYPPWEPCLNGSFSFEFKTEEQHSLLLYLNKGQYFFFEVRLLKGRICLRINTGEEAISIRAGESLNDGKWHSLEVRQNDGITSLKVDGVEHEKPSPGPLQNYLPMSSNDTLLFMGGLPMEYDSKKFKSLALASVIFEPKFRGSIRNFFYSNCGKEPYRPNPLGTSGILTKDIDLCERGNPCLNGGRCLTTDNGLFCDCANTEYRGDRCDLQKIPSDATFLGTQYWTYNLSSKVEFMVSNQDQVMLDFRTKLANSLLFYTGNGKDHITVGLADGGIFLSVNLGSGMYEDEIRPHQTRFDDNLWHQLVIRREAKKINMEVDGMYRKQGSITGKFVRLSSSIMYVAGSPQTSRLPGSKVGINFKGCMRKVRYQADSIRLDLTELARNEHGLLDVVGDVIYDKCQELVDSQPVTFTTLESYLTIPTWDRTSTKGSLAFQFRTMESGGLMMYSNGDKDSRDFFALELLDGHLYLVLNMGSGVHKIQASKIPVTDGTPHDVYFEFSENRGYISVDGQKELFTTSSISDRFDLHGQLYVGGLGPEINVTSLPRELWAAMFGLSYVGCLQDLLLNGNQVDLMAASKLQNMASVVGYCRKTERQCLSLPCNHQGKCIEGWNRFTCDCRATGFVGPVCQTAAVTLRFDGTQFMKVTMATESITQAEDISLRFRTMHPDGLLFLTAGQKGSGMELYLDNGVLFLSVDVGSGAQILSAGHTLNDDLWHTVFIKRRVQTVEMAIDQDRPVTDKLPGSSFLLVTSRIFAGSVSAPRNINADLPGRDKELELSSVEAGHLAQQDEGIGASHSGFIGSMQSFVFNGNHFFQMAKSDTADDIEISAHFSSDEYVVRDPVTFKSVEGYAILPRLQAHEKFTISLQIKTTENDGLILYNGGTGQDFFSMELYQGFLYYIYDMGEGPQRVKANVNQPINDNKWHEIRLLRAEVYKQLLRVDDNTPIIDDLSGAKNNKFDLHGHLYVGGVRKTMYPSLPKQIHSQHGFVGCLGSLDLNGYFPKIVREASPIHESVGEGCRGPLSRCVNDSCANHGKCVQYWTSYTCNCDLTSYTGPMCKDESVSYKFGPGPGLITFTYPDGQQPSTNFDSLAFGFQTFQDEAVLLRMGSKSFDDFIQLELVSGHVYLIYNMGTMNHPLGNFYQKVNDGRYHVVRFTRAGPNATLQIDSDVPQTKNPTVFSFDEEINTLLLQGHQNHIFNNQAYIRIGGKKASNGTIIQHFEGIISGLVLNGIHIFELAKQNSSKVSFEGTVSLNIKAPTYWPKISVKDDIREMQSTEGMPRRKKMKPSTNRLFITATESLMRHTSVSSEDNYIQKQKAIARPKRSHHRSLKDWQKRNIMPESPTRYSVLKIGRDKYETVGKPASNVVAQYDYDEDSSFMDNQVKQFWPEDGNVQTKRYRGVHNVGNNTINVHDLGKDLSSDSDNNIDYDYDDDDTEVNGLTTSTVKPRCEYSGPVKQKVKPKERISDTSENVKPKERIINTSEKVKQQFEWKQHYDSTEDYGVFGVSDPDYEQGGIKERNEGKAGVYERENFYDMQKAIERLSEVMKNLQEDHKHKSGDDEHEGQTKGEDTREGSGFPPVKTKVLATENTTRWSPQGNTRQFHRESTAMTTIPYLAMTHLTHRLSETTTSFFRNMEWEHFQSHTTPKEGVTDDIIFVGASSGCIEDDEDGCLMVTSGNEDEIITTTVIITTTPTTTLLPTRCTGSDCETSTKLNPPPSGSTSTLSFPEGGFINGDGVHRLNDTIHDGFGNDDSTAYPHKDKDKAGDKGINLGLILGITGSVLVAVIVLCIALCKLRSRDEGTYKVDETQNFSSLQSKKSSGNGTMASGSDSGTGKRGKKKDVKEWYV